MSGQNYKQLTLFQGDSPASRLVLPGSEEARKMTVTSGRKCCGLYQRSGPLGSLVRTLLVSYPWRSTRCYLTWKASATPAKRLLFRLVPSMPRIDGTDARLWATPAARDYKGANSVDHLTREGRRNHTDQLANAVKLFPTPKAQNSRGSGERHGDGGQSLDVEVGGQLNPDWVEWLMGFPIGWTSLEIFPESPLAHTGAE